MIKDKLCVNILIKMTMNIGWIIGSALLIYKTNFFRQIWENPHKVMFFFDIAMIGVGVNIAFMLYMTVYLPYIKKISEDFETYCP